MRSSLRRRPRQRCPHRDTSRGASFVKLLQRVRPGGPWERAQGLRDRPPQVYKHAERRFAARSRLGSL